MIKFLNKERLIKELDGIFSGAEEFMYIVSPYVKLDSWLRKNIKECSAEEFILVYGKKMMEQKSYYFFDDFADIDLFFHPDLHAKVYINEKFALVSSMNLYDYSLDNNIECGVLIPSEEKSYDYVLDFVADIIEDSRPLPGRLNKKKFKKKKI